MDCVAEASLGITLLRFPFRTIDVAESGSKRAKKLWGYGMTRRLDGVNVRVKLQMQVESPCSTSTSSARGFKTFCTKEWLDDALVALVRMDQQGRVPSVLMYKKLLQACMRTKALAETKQVHAILKKHRLECHRVLGELVVTSLVNGGSFADGCEVFQRLSHRSVLSWTSVISGYINVGRPREALACYEQMIQDGVEPNKYTFVSLVKACSKLEDLEEGRRIHVATVRHGFESDIFVASTLVSMYAKCRSIGDAQVVFDGLSQRNVVVWNAILAAYGQQGRGEEALQLYERMRREGHDPDSRTFVSALQACGSVAEKEESMLLDGQHLKVEALQKGKEVHAETIRMGFQSDEFVVGTLVSMYAKCGSFVDAQQVFHLVSRNQVIAWTAMLTAHAQQGQAELALQIYQRMREEGVRLESRAFISALQACCTLAESEEGVLLDGQKVKVTSLHVGKGVHAGATEMGFQADILVGNTLVSTFAKCGSIPDACEVFNELPKKDVVSWTAMITAFAQRGHGEQALLLFWTMQCEVGISPNEWTFVSALQACCSLADTEEGVLTYGENVKVDSLQKGKKVHAAATESGFDSDGFVGCSLVSMYAKSGSIRDAEQIFDDTGQRSLVLWNVMITSYAEHNQGARAWQTYLQMQQEGVEPDVRTFVSALQACGSNADSEKGAYMDRQVVKVDALRQAKVIHAKAASLGVASDMFLSSVLLSTYARCGSLRDAELVFDSLLLRDVVSWTVMMGAYVQQGQGQKVLQLYAGMQAAGLQLDEATFVAVLEACSITGALDICVHTHQTIIETGYDCTMSVANSLIHAYGKCGSMVDAQHVFESLSHPDVVSWTALIAGYARLGDYSTSKQRFKEMCLAGTNPNAVTFLALLSSCSHAGLVDEGLQLFESMTRDHGLSATLEHYACVIDLVGRAGLLSKAAELLVQMPMQPDLPVWMCLLAACRKHGNAELGRRAFNAAVALEPTHAPAYLLMSNIYADAGLWERAKEIEDLRRRSVPWQQPGKSWIEHEEEMHTFLVRDKRHRKEALLYTLLTDLSKDVYLFQSRKRQVNELATCNDLQIGLMLQNPSC